MARHRDEANLTDALDCALALGAWAEPRATRDVDLNIRVQEEGLDAAFDTLEAASVELDRTRARQEAAERGMFVGWRGEYRVDVFVPSIPFYDIAHNRIVRVGFADTPVAVLSAETLSVFKMLFFRPKDLVDLERLIEIQGAGFDAAFVRDALVQMLGLDDERVHDVGSVETCQWPLELTHSRDRRAPNQEKDRFSPAHAGNGGAEIGS